MVRILMYTTGACPYCRRAKALLHSKSVVQIEEIRIDLVADAAADMERITGRRTVPQIFIGERHVGGFDDLAALERSGALDELLSR